MTKLLKCQLLIWLALLTICLTSNAFGQWKVYKRIEPDSAAQNIRTVGKGKWFYNSSNQDYTAWPRSKHEKAYVRIKLSYDYAEELEKTNGQVTFWKYTAPIAFVFGLITGVYIAK